MLHKVNTCSTIVLTINNSVDEVDDKRQTIPSVMPLFLKINGMVAQIEEIIPRKLLANKSNELHLINRCSYKQSSVTWKKE